MFFQLTTLVNPAEPIPIMNKNQAKKDLRVVLEIPIASNTSVFVGPVYEKQAEKWLEENHFEHRYDDASERNGWFLKQDGSSHVSDHINFGNCICPLQHGKGGIQIRVILSPLAELKMCPGDGPVHAKTQES